MLNLECQGCHKSPSELDEYIFMAEEENCTPEEFVWKEEEGTLNKSNGHFLCTDCYNEAGQPSSKEGWKCP